MIEGRRASRAALLWLGVITVVGVHLSNSRLHWPVVPLDVARSYEILLALGAAAFLVGAWAGLRDKRHGTTALIEVTPAGRKLLLAGRSTGITATSALIAVATLALIAASSRVQGGGGGIAVGLLVEFAGFGALTAMLGFATGTLTGSRLVSLFAAPAFGIWVFWMEGRLSVPIKDGLWLLPHVTPPQWYGPAGYLPDIWLIHGLYLMSLSVLVGVVVVFVTGRRQAMASTGVWTKLLGVGAAIAVVASGGWLLQQPESVLLYGSGANEWLPEDGSDSVYKEARRLASAGFPDERYATECATTLSFEACVYPEYGKRFAELMSQSLARLEPVNRLPGVPTQARMVPTYTSEPCGPRGEYLLVGSWPDSYASGTLGWKADEAFSCAIGQRHHTSAKAAITTWVSFQITESQQPDDYHFGRRKVPAYMEAARDLAEMPVPRVVDLLLPIWGPMQRGEIGIGELRAAIANAR